MLQLAQLVLDLAVGGLDVPSAVASGRSLVVRVWRLLSLSIFLRTRPQVTVEQIVAFRSASHITRRSNI